MLPALEFLNITDSQTGKPIDANESSRGSRSTVIGNQARLRPTSPRLRDRLRPGSRVGCYKLICELGRGGMGAVYLAEDTILRRQVAIKFLRECQPELTARFIIEARATARCVHPNIVVIHDVGEYQGSPYLVLEYLHGSSLHKLLRKHHALPQERAIHIAICVARALVEVHQHNIVHRDLKPANIFITESDTVKVLDFGVAKLTHGRAVASGAASPSLVERIAQAADWDAPQITGPSLSCAHDLSRRGALVGTIPYMSPEQWSGDDLDHRADIWAMGILLYRMVVGRHPLGALKGTQLAVVGSAQHVMPSARGVCPDMAHELAAIIDRCLIKDRRQRMGSATELRDALEALARPDRE